MMNNNQLLEIFVSDSADDTYLYIPTACDVPFMIVRNMMFTQLITLFGQMDVSCITAQQIVY